LKRVTATSNHQPRPYTCIGNKIWDQSCASSFQFTFDLIVCEAK